VSASAAGLSVESNGDGSRRKRLGEKGRLENQKRSGACWANTAPIKLCLKPQPQELDYSLTPNAQRPLHTAKTSFARHHRKCSLTQGNVSRMT
jgi:hypothetical protein